MLQRTMSRVLGKRHGWYLWMGYLLVSVAIYSSACSQDNSDRRTRELSETHPSSLDEQGLSEQDKPSDSSVNLSASSSSPISKTDNPYINRLLPEAQRLQAEYGIPVDVTIAIAIHETGWGKYVIGQNNHFGLRCVSDDCVTLSKRGRQVQYETCQQASECFDMFADSIVELSDGNPENLRAIYRNGYATSPRWVRSVRKIRTQVQKALN